MKKTDVLKRINETGLLPVLRASSAVEALALAQAIEAGGISALEVTMTVPHAIDVIQSLANQTGDRILIGAGTVLDPETARACILAGAQFIVSPSLNLKTIEICHRYSIVVIPGALTPTEVVAAWEAGADVVKVFPCSAMGGAKYLKALKAPFPQIEVIPTGGVSLFNAAEFLAAGAFALGVGADLVNLEAIANGTPEVITQNARQYVEIVRAARC
ncbi:MAG TPA: bifunctional 2-keto-4-hydroxyglutarate aldolase/2-keto-3-deoxy-6-phosphogluconate aldolase [Terracidiphilus sp.]|jgi:2-dehydro-3-deoxyphosphogluconate aldolase/(4S)-4-hydroxy-2-oxoglutarate aldolase